MVELELKVVRVVAWCFCFANSVDKGVRSDVGCGTSRIVVGYMPGLRLEAIPDRQVALTPFFPIEDPDAFFRQKCWQQRQIRGSLG